MFYKDRVVLVTGGTGFVGIHITQELLKQGARVRVPIHNRTLPIKNKHIETVQADLMKQEDCLRVSEGVDYVFHAAGAVAGAAVTSSNSMSAITTNLILTAQMLQAAWSANIKRMLIFSSSTAYPAAEYPVKEEDMWNGQPHPAYFGYGWMRRYLEKLGEFVASKSGVKIAIVRPTAVYGRWDNFSSATSHVIPALIRRAVEKENPYVVWGTGEEVRDFLHITDFARACLLMLEKNATCDPVNIGYGSGFAIKKVLRVILNASGYDDADVVFDSSKPTTILYRIVDTSKAKKLLGFEPYISLEEGLKDTIEWYIQTYRRGRPC